MISIDDIEFKWISHITMKGQYQEMRRDNRLGLQMETLCNRDPHGFPRGKSKQYFFIDHDEREFLSIEDLIDAYNEKFQFSEENPEEEIKYLKVIVKRDRAINHMTI